MPGEDLPESVKRLIAESIDSIPELEAILLMREDRGHQWTAAEAGQRLYVSTTVAGHILRVLAGRGFLSRKGENFRYEPASPELDGVVAALAACYSRALVDVTTLIHSKPSASVRQFADAFRLRRDK